MSNISTVTGALTGYSASPSGSGDVTAMSPDALLAYCQMQLGSLDGEMKTQMDAQELALQQRTVVEGVQTTLESFGDAGPQNEGQLIQCSQAFDTAIAQLPVGDPVAAQLAAQQTTMNSKYGGTPPFAMGDATPLPNPPKNDDWKGTVDAAGNLADGIKSDAEIQMLQLQDVVSQRQQVVEQATGMMNKEDQTLEDAAKAIGQ